MRDDALHDVAPFRIQVNRWAAIVHRKKPVVVQLIMNLDHEHPVSKFRNAVELIDRYFDGLVGIVNTPLDVARVRRGASFAGVTSPGMDFAYAETDE